MGKNHMQKYRKYDNYGDKFIIDKLDKKNHETSEHN